MGGNAVRTIIMLMGIVVLSVLIGGMISDSMSKSMGAFALIAFICVAFGMLLVGKRCWQLLYFVPAFLFNAPLLGGSAGLSIVPLSMFAAACVWVYGIMMWAMGYIRFKWNSLLLLDLYVAAISLLFIWSFIQHPLTLQILDEDAEYVGGKEYIWFSCAVLYYIAISSMGDGGSELIPTLKKSFYVFCAGQALYSCYGMMGVFRAGIGAQQRYSFFADLCCAVLFFLYCSAPIAKLLASPKTIFAALTAFAGVFFGGRREVLVAVLAALTYAALLKKELTGVIVAGAFMYGGLVLLGSQHVWNHAPHAVQRVMATVPGVEVPEQIKAGTEGSSETRRMVWSLGMDPRTGYIKDYIWGDGFQTQTAYLRRGKVAAMRKTLDTSEWGFARSLAGIGNWHNGWLTMLHRLGIVGLVSLNILFVIGMVLLAKVSNAYRMYKEYPHLMALCLPFAQTALSYAWGTQTLLHYFAAFQALGIIKILYCKARDQGMMRPLFFREQYIPMTIREMDSAR